MYNYQQGETTVLVSYYVSILTSCKRLENYPLVLMLLFTGGLQYPIPAALGGAVWIAGRVAYSKGYYTGGMLEEDIYSQTHFFLIFGSFLLSTKNCSTFLVGFITCVDPTKRMRGSFGYLGLAILFGSSSMFGAKLLGWL